MIRRTPWMDRTWVFDLPIGAFPQLVLLGSAGRRRAQLT